MRSKRTGRRYLAALVIMFALAFLVIGTLGPAGHSPYYWVIVPPPALVAASLGWRAWSGRRSTAYSAALVLLLVVLVFSHLLSRSAA
jgi:hypothetical protein